MKTATKSRQRIRMVRAVDYKKVVDDLQRVRRDLKLLKADEEHLRKQLIDGGSKRYNGTVVDAVLVDGVQVRLDTDKIRADMPAEWLKDHTKTIPTTTIELETRVPS